MNWIDYREKLGLCFRDNEKAKMLANMIANYVDYGTVEENYGPDDYYRFCQMVGRKYEDRYLEVFGLGNIFVNKPMSMSDLVSYFIALVNTYVENNRCTRKDMIDELIQMLKNLNLRYELIHDENGYYVFPGGAKELDDALVSQPLDWLAAYPRAYKTFCNALRQYSEGIYIRDVADNLRKALEEFLQEFLGNTKNLETNKNEICKYLGEQGVDAGISGLFHPLINAYKNINDRIAKHNDAVDEKLLEFLLYQTGVLIRMVIVTSKS